MSYLQFHAAFVLPPILLLLLTGRPSLRAVGWAGAAGLALMALIALLYTTPWDNYLVARGVWGYGEGRVVGTIGYVPVEEYAFFVLQTVLVGLWLYRLLGSAGGTVPEAAPRPLARWGGALLWLIVGASGLLLLRSEAGLYLGLILVWAAPVLALQWAIGGHALWAARRSLLLGTAVPTLYLWVADRLALGFGIWAISERYTTGFEVFGMPVEEMVFFAATTLMVVQGLLLFLWVCERIRKGRARRTR